MQEARSNRLRRCWIAPRDARPSQRFTESIGQAIEESRLVVLLLSSHANVSAHVKLEIEIAMEAGILIIPFRIENVFPRGSLEMHLSRMHWLDALTPPLESHLKRLSQVVKSILAGKSEQRLPIDSKPSPIRVSLEPEAVFEKALPPACEAPTAFRRRINLLHLRETLRRRSGSAIVGTVRRAARWFRIKEEGQSENGHEDLDQIVGSLSDQEVESGYEGHQDSCEERFSEVLIDHRHKVEDASEPPLAPANVELDALFRHDLSSLDKDISLEEGSLGPAMAQFELDLGEMGEAEFDGDFDYITPACRVEESQAERTSPAPNQFHSLLTVAEMDAQVRSDIPELHRKRPAISLGLGEKILIAIPGDTIIPCTQKFSIKGVVGVQRAVVEICEDGCRLLQIPLPGIKGSGGTSVNVSMTLHHDGHHLRIEFHDKQSAWKVEEKILLRQWDQVDCTVFSQSEAVSGEDFMVQAFLHLPTQANEAEALAKSFDDEAERRGSQSLRARVARGSSLTFHLVTPGLEIDNNVQECAWHGAPTSVQFGILVPSGLGAKSVISTLTVSQQGVPIGHIKFKVKILEAQTADGGYPKPVGEPHSYECFFVSYAAQDRPEVVKRVQILRLVGKKVFQDLLDLDPGARWERQLYRWIDESDAVLLFWSSNAKNSEWVMKECQYAIQTKGIEFIIPVIIEGPPPVEPPPELAELHMNDRLIYFMQ